jgi:hypothetical protein
VGWAFYEDIGNRWIRIYPLTAVMNHEVHGKLPGPLFGFAQYAVQYAKNFMHNAKYTVHKDKVGYHMIQIVSELRDQERP